MPMRIINPISLKNNTKQDSTTYRVQYNLLYFIVRPKHYIASFLTLYIIVQAKTHAVAPAI
jgi:hypothetical protein